MKPEEFPQNTLNPISLNRVAYLPACRNPQALFMCLVEKEKDLKMFCALPFPVAKHSLEFRSFKQLFTFTQGEFINE